MTAPSSDRPDRSSRPRRSHRSHLSHRRERSHRPRRRPQLPGRWRVAVPLVAAVAGLLFVSSAVSSAGIDLRAGNTDLEPLVRERAEQVDALRAEVDALQDEVDRLGAGVADAAVRDLRGRVAAVGDSAGLTAVSGPGLLVSLDDAPTETVPDGVDPNVLIVHQQDIQAFVNALWAGGAVGVTLQGQRLVSTTGIKCVGNSVVLEGVPYAPPYRIAAVGDPDELLSSLEEEPTVDLYRQAVDQYGLGLAVEPAARLDLPGYQGQPAMDYATAL